MKSLLGGGSALSGWLTLPVLRHFPSTSTGVWKHETITRRVTWVVHVPSSFVDDTELEREETFFFSSSWRAFDRGAPMGAAGRDDRKGGEALIGG